MHWKRTPCLKIYIGSRYTKIWPDMVNNFNESPSSVDQNVDWGLKPSRTYGQRPQFDPRSHENTSILLQKACVGIFIVLLCIWESYIPCMTHISIQELQNTIIIQAVHIPPEEILNSVVGHIYGLGHVMWSKWHIISSFGDTLTSNSA